MEWKDCTEHTRIVTPDIDRIISLRKMAIVRQQMVQSVEISKDTASAIVMDYYEVIKNLLTALLLKNGLKSTNHLCLIAFFKEYYPKYYYEVNLIDKLRIIRNKAAYEGFFANPQFIRRNITEIKYIIAILFELTKENI